MSAEQSSWYPWKVLIVVESVLFLFGADSTIVNLALPVITKDLQAPLAWTQWIISVFLISTAVTLPIAGRLSDIIGRKKVFIGGMILFTIASFFCATLHSLKYLIVMRIFQALGCAGALANCNAIVSTVFPPHRQGLVMGINGTVFSIGMAVGIFGGGYLIEFFSWPAIFTINVLFGIPFILISFFVLIEKKISVQHKEPLSFDYVGSVLFIGAIFCILSALTFYTGNTSTPTIRLSMLFLGITLLLSFILVEKRHPCPLLSLDIYKIHAFAFGNLIRLLASNSYYALLLIIPFYAQAGLNLSPSQSGMLLLPFTLSFLIIAPLGGHLADRLGTRPITSIGFAISAMTTAVFLLSNYLWHKTPSSLELSFVLLFYGIGLALINGPNNGAVLRAVSHRQKGVASGLLFTLGFLGGSCGIAITSGIIHREQMAKLSESLTILYAGTDVFYFLLFINCLGSILSLMRPNTNHHK